MNHICERSAKCPIYNEILKSNEIMIDTYKGLYCNAGQENYSKCKRYQVSKIIGWCPGNILPNSQISIEDIVKEAKAQEEGKK